ncbi:hypothetical protein AB0K52_18325 [Glycomyces sp. NPDC049804]|uniref:hypothetical protein n=1 Tax=Glycomyces sp. NPDC049804 TaxID=3154363 RepID=UPI00341C91FB
MALLIFFAIGFILGIFTVMTLSFANTLPTLSGGPGAFRRIAKDRRNLSRTSGIRLSAVPRASRDRSSDRPSSSFLGFFSPVASTALLRVECALFDASHDLEIRDARIATRRFAGHRPGIPSPLKRRPHSSHRQAAGRQSRVEKVGIMKSGVQVAGAIGVGYLLGRNHKMRMALTLGAAAAAGRLGRRRAKGKAADDAASSGDLGQFAEPGKRLLEAGKAAAMAAVTSRIGEYSDRLRERAEVLRHPNEGEGQAEATESKQTEVKAEPKAQEVEPEAKETEDDSPEEAPAAKKPKSKEAEPAAKKPKSERGTAKAQGSKDTGAKKPEAKEKKKTAAASKKKESEKTGAPVRRKGA